MAHNRKLKISGVLLLLFVICLVVAAVFFSVKLISGMKEKVPASEKTVSDSTDTVAEQEETIPGDLEEEPVLSEPDADLSADAPHPIHAHSELLSLYPDTVLPLSDEADEAYLDSIVFVGDSTTYGLKRYGMLKDGQDTLAVWTPKSGTLAMWNLLSEEVMIGETDSLTIPDAAERYTPSVMIFTLGVNGISILEKDEFIQFYSELIDAVKSKSPDTRIILQSVYPICSYYTGVGITIDKIHQANDWIVELADEKGVHYLNTVTVLVGSDGYLKDNYCNGDGIHISEEGFKTILQYIRSHKMT